jgi:hypothetical protein
LWIEVKLQELLLISRHKNLNCNYSELWESAFSIPLLQNTKVLFVIGKINRTTFESIRSFNSMRNKIIHKLFHEDYDKGVKKIKLEEYDKAFKYGMELSWKLEGIIGKLATRGKVG